MEEVTSQHYNYLGVNVKTTDYNMITIDLTNGVCLI